MWDGLAAKLDAFPQVRVDPGYFGPQRLTAQLAAALPGDILVGHSAGLLWGLRQRRDWAGVVAINSFDRFTLDKTGRGCVKPAALRVMEKSLARDANKCVENFRASIGASPSAQPARAETLAEGLALLRDFDAAPLLAQRPVPMLVLAAENDALAPPSAARRLAEAAGGRFALRASGGHGLPWTAPDFCAEVMMEFLRAHEL
jgi:pimeloyl-[acyl-carrier protein] methyl ester esterase